MYGRKISAHFAFLKVGSWPVFVAIFDILFKAGVKIEQKIAFWPKKVGKWPVSKHQSGQKKKAATTKKSHF